MEELLRYRWPGNVREMKNVIERAVVLTRGEYIDADDLAPLAAEDGRRHRNRPQRWPGGPCGAARRWPTWNGNTSWTTLSITGWNKSRAATILGIERSTLDRKIRRYELVEARYGDDE